MRILLQISFALLFCALPARAEDSPYKGGMRYTTMNASSNKEEPREDGEGIVHQKEINPPAQEEKPAEDQAEKVWKKYKDLAAGEYEEEMKEPEKAATKEGSALPDINQKAQAPAQPTGIAAILQEYQENKVQRRQMRMIEVKGREEKTIDLSKDKAVEDEKPEAEPKPEKQQ
jgi:hypothetical protein